MRGSEKDELLFGGEFDACTPTTSPRPVPPMGSVLLRLAETAPAPTQTTSTRAALVQLPE
jgi:hypothetical protein